MTPIIAVLSDILTVVWQPIPIGLGAVLSWLCIHGFRRFRARPIPIQWNASYQHLALSANDATFGKVEVSHNGNVCRNLFTTKVTIHNGSPTDVDNLEILFELRKGVEFLAASGSIEGIKIPFSASFEKDGRFFLSLKSDQREYESARDYVARHRGFQILCVNRGSTAEFTFLIHHFDDQKWRIDARCIHKGVRFSEHPGGPGIWGVTLKHSVSTGLLLGFALSLVAAHYITNPFTVAAAAFVIGTAGIPIGAAAILAVKSVGRFFSGPTTL
jgi:hypothetical protein